MKFLIHLIVSMHVWSSQPPKFAIVVVFAGRWALVAPAAERRAAACGVINFNSNFVL
jgi:hypothetical protein